MKDQDNFRKPRLTISSVAKRFAWLLSLLLFGFILVSRLDNIAILFDPKQTERWLIELGAFAPFAFIAVMALAIVVSPIPTLPLDIVAGIYFGPFIGGLYAVTGGLLGAVASFLIARFLGRSLVERLLRGHINFCTECSDKLLARILFVSRLLPFVSFDVVSYGAGLTRMSLRSFALATFFGMAPLTFVYTYLGPSLLDVEPVIAFPVGMALVFLFFSIPRWIERYDFLGLRRFFHHE